MIAGSAHIGLLFQGYWLNLSNNKIDNNISSLFKGFDNNIPGFTTKIEENGVAIFESGDRRIDGSVLPVEVSARIILG